MKKIRNILYLSLFVVSSLSLKAQVSAYWKNSQVSLGDTAYFVISIDGEIKRPPELPQVNGLDFLGRSESTNISIINGKIARQRTFTFTVTPSKVGYFTVPEISLEVAGKVEKTKVDNEAV